MPIIALTIAGCTTFSAVGLSGPETEALLATALGKVLSDRNEIDPRKITFVCLPGDTDPSSELLERVSKPGYQLYRCSELKYDEVRSPVLKGTNLTGTAIVLQRPSRIDARQFEMKVTFVRGNLSNSSGVLNLRGNGFAWEVSKCFINAFS